jgi:hypothetical protein
MKAATSALLLLPLLAACGGDDGAPAQKEPPGKARLHGVLAGEVNMGEGVAPGPEIGEAFVTLEGPLVPDATEKVTGKGTLTVGPVVAPLAGTYDTSGLLTVDGADYFLTANTDGDVLRGTYRGPASTGQLLLVRAGAAAFCGTFTGGEHGPLAWVEAADSSLHGTLTSLRLSSSFTLALEGKRTGDTIELHGGENFSITGTITKGRNQLQEASGDFHFDRGGGVFSASEAACSGG